MHAQQTLYKVALDLDMVRLSLIHKRLLNAKHNIMCVSQQAT